LTASNSGHAEGRRREGQQHRAQTRQTPRHVRRPSDRARFPGKPRQYTTWLPVVVVVFFPAEMCPPSLLVNADDRPLLEKFLSSPVQSHPRPGWRPGVSAPEVVGAPGTGGGASRCTTFTKSVYASVSRLSRSYNRFLPFLYPLSMYAM
jgi:hypothetical protein